MVLGLLLMLLLILCLRRRSGSGARLLVVPGLLVESCRANISYRLTSCDGSGYTSPRHAPSRPFCTVASSLFFHLSITRDDEAAW